MGIFVVPGAYTQEKDFSLYAPVLSSSIAAMPIVSPKGRSNFRELITTHSQLINTYFGDNDVPILSAINQDFFRINFALILSFSKERYSARRKPLSDYVSVTNKRY